MDKISLYVHIPFCMKKCDYCDFLSGVYDERTEEQYVYHLCQEIRFLGNRMKDRKVETVYIGGGTPTWLHLREMEKILKTLRDSFSLSSTAEFTIECNPGTVTEEKLKTYRMYGINRLSIGLQSARERELQCLGRVHTLERFYHTYDIARKVGYGNINVDLMTGLPGQRLDDLLYTLEHVIRLRPSHISAYALMIEEGTPFYERYQSDVRRREAGEETLELPDEDLEYQLYKMTQHVLINHGYEQYEISNYARPGYRCDHNCIYWTRGDYLGLGIGAASLVGHHRGTNVSDMEEYMRRCHLLATEGEQALWQEEEIALMQTEGFVSPLWDGMQSLSRREEMEEFMFLGLRMNQGVTRQSFETAFGCRMEGIYGSELKKLKQEGMLEMENGRLFLTEQGRDLSNYVLAHFLIEQA